MSETDDTESTPPRRFVNLSIRLLILTVSFVMLAEVLIWAPSIARFRLAYMEDYIGRAHLAMLALNAMPETQPNQDLENELLFQTDALAIIVAREGRKMLMVGGDMPPAVDLTVDMRDVSFFGLIFDAFDVMVRSDNRVIRAIGMPPRQPDAVVEVLFEEQTMRKAMFDFSARILNLSIVISFITASMVYISLQWMIVRPIQRITRSMMRFRDNPEDVSKIVEATGRSDEIGTAQFELAEMQRQVQSSLKQQGRLAALGGAMAKINHDLRNTLATAVLVSDKLQYIEDPEVKRVTPRLMKAIDRAIDLCSQTLNYAADDALVLRPRKFGLYDLIEEVRSNLSLSDDFAETVWDINVAPGVDIVADRRHLLRGIANLCSNAVQAGGTKISISAETSDGTFNIDVADNGPGLSEKARENLFKPFSSSSRKGGTGLGLVIVRDIVHGHGGEVIMIRSDADGTTFRIVLPDDIKEHPSKFNDDI